ncbi:Spore germination protein B3 [Paenibacillus solanacearum]|uniref:Spore germination protein B3 n=1 Tax=Paenibacillus solanacearum TaxID=2048548 RepID=A0A916NUU8_9BACL|nr:Ger(x)C family spore germination protein [Paenibacillus solanacearum]CAG7600477.1 Spore germination protein B3 [Paenibacillus solanacearum]
MRGIAIGLALSVILTMMPGCWSRKELNELAVVMALGVDLHKDGYIVSAQVLNSSEVGSKERVAAGSSPVITYKSAGRTIPDALQRLLNVAPRMLYLSHVRILVFGESLARKGLSDALDFISRDHQLRNDFFLLVAKNTEASEILDVISPFEQIPANSLYSSILIAHKKWAATGKIKLQQFITELERGGSDPIISGVLLEGDPEAGQSLDNIKSIQPKTLLKHAGLAVFKKDRLVGWLGEAASKTVNYALNEVDTTVGNIACPGSGVAGFVIERSASSFDVRLDENGKPSFVVKLRAEANLNAVQCSADLSSPLTVEAFEKELERKMERHIGHYVREVQHKYGADIFGFGEMLHRKYPNLWRSYRTDWDEIFPTVDVGVRADVSIRRIGSIIQPQKRKMMER